ncbi:MAG: FG-GAP repeat protein, partial [Verrucomicrobiae bacterium]|nr:FG-GAP repeat protein [Verrucomicrobiae bacterium]
LCLPLIANARQPIDRILLPRDLSDRSEFGNALAVNDRWIAVGDHNAEGEKGVVTIYSAITGRRVRELRAPDAADGDNFGASLSLCGNKLLIGAPESGNHMGAAYLMDVLSGRLIHRFQASPAVSDDLFGSSVALSDRYVLIALPGRNDGKGLVEIYETLSGEYEEKLDPMDLAANDAFGSSLALSGQLALVGAPFEGNNEGAAYLFDLRARQLLRKLVSPNRAAGRLFGYDVALDGDRAVVGEPGNGPGGKAYFFDLQSNGAGVEFPDSAGSFGNQVELDGGLALIGAPDDETAYLYDVSRMERLRILTASDGLNAFGQHVAFRGEQALFGVRSSGGGSVHYIRPLAGPLPMDTVTQTRNYAPGVIQGDFSRFYQPLINPDGEVFFTAGLTGPGTTGGRNQGLWTNFQGDLDTVGIVGGSAEIVGPGLKTGRLLRFVSSR